MEIEVGQVAGGHRVVCRQLDQVVAQRLQLVVFRVAVERNDRDAVAQVVCESRGGVVHDQDVLQIDVLENAQVFCKSLVSGSYLVLSFKAMLARQDVLEVLALGIDQVPDFFGVFLGCRSEQHEVVDGSYSV